MGEQMWHRACGIRRSCMFQFSNLLIQAEFRSALLKDGGGDYAHNINNLMAELIQFKESLIII